MYIRSMLIWFQVLGLPFELCLEKVLFVHFVLLPCLLQQYLLLLFIWSFLATWGEGGAVSVVLIKTLGHACVPAGCGPLSSALSMAELVGSALNTVPYSENRLFTFLFLFFSCKECSPISWSQPFYIPTPRLMLLLFWVRYLALPTYRVSALPSISYGSFWPIWWVLNRGFMEKEPTTVVEEVIKRMWILVDTQARPRQSGPLPCPWSVCSAHCSHCGNCFKDAALRE